MMTNVIFTMNDKHKQSKNEYNRLRNQANHTSNPFQSLVNLSVSVTFLFFTTVSKSSFSYSYVLRAKSTMCPTAF